MSDDSLANVSSPGDDTIVPSDGSSFNPGGVPDDIPFDPLAAGSGGAKRLSGGSLLVVAVVLIAVAGIVSMKKLAQVTRAAAVDTEIAATIEDFLRKRDDRGPEVTPTGGPKSNIGDMVLAQLSESYTERQVPLQDVQRNPFILFKSASEEGPVDPVDTTDPSAEQERRWRQERDARRTAMEQAGSGFALKSIMGGSVPLAILNQGLVRIGDSLKAPNSEIVFEVEDISGDAVMLVTEDPQFKLTVRIAVQLDR